MLFFFFFNDTATTEIYTLSLHDALPISTGTGVPSVTSRSTALPEPCRCVRRSGQRSEEHTSELQSRLHLVCRLLLEKKKKKEKNKEIEKEVRYAVLFTAGIQYTINRTLS